jgi:ATP-dependent DNA helicase RecG
MNLTDSVTEISGVGNKYKILLEKLGIRTIEDLLWHIPFRYEDRTNVKKISELVANEKAVVIGTVEKIDNIFTRYGKKLTKGVIRDETGVLQTMWFNQIYLKKSLPIGSTVKLYGELDQSSTKPQFVSPEWELYSETAEETEKYIPVYSTTNGVSNNFLRTKIQSIIKKYHAKDILGEKILKEHKLLDIHTALNILHNPGSLEEIETAKKRIAFEEMLFLHLRGIQIRNRWEQKKNSHIIKISDERLGEFKKNLPFELTDAQNRSIKEILEDLSSKTPMNRLLQGDVGSGKTVVAAAAILATAESKFNSIIIAPTQILAEQHHKTLQKVLKDSGISVELLTGKTKPTNLKAPYTVVATHAILHNLESFKDIGLIIVDEQHKFGVEQRTIVVDHYTKKGKLMDTLPNLLTMTATPIPRSLALTFYGDLDLSVIDEIPKNRKGVKTWLINDKKRKAAYKWIEEQIITKQTQVFVVCPFIEESENVMFQTVKAAEIEYEKLLKVFPNLRLGLLHGRLKNDEKDKVIAQMLNHEIDILVTTPVIEVGVDIPNANIILIETPERFGLASLHQLRGRVGRGSEEGYCFLMTSTKAGESIQRLKYMETVHNGNKLAEIDLELRGPGDIYGTSQSGFSELKAASITDIELIKETKVAALEIFSQIKDYPQIAEKLKKQLYVEEN